MTGPIPPKFLVHQSSIPVRVFHTPISLLSGRYLTAYGLTFWNLAVERMAYWERIRQSKLNLSYQWRRYSIQNPYASSSSFTASHAKSSLSSTASQGRSCLSPKPCWAIQNSNRPSDFCNNMRLFGGPAQVSSVHCLLILWVRLYYYSGNSLICSWV